MSSFLLYIHEHVYVHTCLAHIEEILAVVERAGKDIAVEELLKNLEEVWLSMTFQFSPHKRLHSGDQVHLQVCIMYINMYID